MNKFLRWTLGFGVMTALGGCCQSVWFDVTRKDSAPLSSEASPEVQGGPIAIPVNLENRFLKNMGPVPEGLQAYTDQINPKNERVEEVKKAFAALERLLLQGGEREINVLEDPNAAPYSAWLGECDEDAAGEPDCRGLHVKGYFLQERPDIARVQIIGKGKAITQVIPVESISPAKTKPKSVEEAEQVSVTPEEPWGSDIVLTGALRAEKGDEIKVQLGKISLSKSFLTFVHLSDTQIRDADVKLGDEKLSAGLDHVIESFEHDTDQELYGSYVAEAMVATINQEVAYWRGRNDEGNAPRLVMHTGDSIDSGTRRELLRFHGIMDRLNIPWFNVIGNHDVLIFGNLLPNEHPDNDSTCVDQATILAPYSAKLGKNWFLPARLCVSPKIRAAAGSANAIGPDDHFIAGFNHEISRRNFIEGHSHDPVRVDKLVKYYSVDMPKECKLMRAGVSDKMHGFDLRPRKAGEAISSDGYYAFAVNVKAGDGIKRRALFVALNTEDLNEHEGGNSGRIRQKQLDWLIALFQTCIDPYDMVMLFGHHGLGEIKLPNGTSLRSHELIKDKRIVGYFYGHHHANGLCRQGGSCKDFWELEADSLQEYPQEGRLVRFKYVGGGWAFIETVTFGERLVPSEGEFSRRVNWARKGAERDFCLINKDECSHDGRVRRSDGANTHARLFFKLPAP